MTDDKLSRTFTAPSLAAIVDDTRALGDDTATRETSDAAIPASCNACVHARCPRGKYVISLNFSSHVFVRCVPGARQRSMNSSVALAAPINSAASGACVSSLMTNAAAASPPFASSELPARPVRISALATTETPCDWRARMSAPIALRTLLPRSMASAVSSRRKAACTTVALVLSA